MNDAQPLFPILGQQTDHRKWKPIDLENPTVERKSTETTVDYLYRILDDANAYKDDNILYGGYLEKRIYYSQSTHFKNQDDNRNIHIGIDIWAKAKTPLYAPTDLVIHSMKYNDNYLDYGGAIIAQIDNGPFLLFGHVSKSSLKLVTVNQRLHKGDVIAYLGNESENGGWPPHLHFQVIRDIEDYYGDYPGVVSEEKLPFYSQNCPNPSIFIREISQH